MTIRPVQRDTAVKLPIMPKLGVDKNSTGILFERIEQVSCPHCGSFVTLTEARSLSLIPCPHCGGKVFVAVRLANFLVHSNIGEGEMGTIYRATDESLGREVAIKLIRGSYSEDPDACERLRKEACALGRLNHPRVAQVYALSFSNGHPYLVMELVTGEDFEKKVLEEGHLDERVVLRMVGDVAEGLAALNREGLVHSDIKPANIVMDRDGNSKLVDFGLTGMSRYDGNHNLMGTPDYIAPELILGEEDSPRSDIFSLGATLYHLLAGHAPSFGVSTKEVLKARIDKTPITPLEEVSPHVSPATCKMVMKMLEYKKEDRLQNSDILAYEVKEALRLLDARSAVHPGVDSFGKLEVSSSSQDKTTPLTDEDKANARDGFASLYGESLPAPEPSSLLPVSTPRPQKRPLKIGRIIFCILLLFGVALAVAVQYPPCDKIWDLYYCRAVAYVNDVAKRQPIVGQGLQWSGQKIDEFKRLVMARFGTLSEEPAALLPPRADFTDEAKQTWQITNIGGQAKSGGTMQTGGTLMIQLPGVAVDKWASWRNGYDHGRFVWSKVSTKQYAFSARILSTANNNPLDVTGIQVKGADASTCPCVLFGFLGNGELFFQVRNPENKAIVIKKDILPIVAQRYLMIVRRDSLFEALYSSDGIAWTPFGRCALDLPADHTVGFSISAVDPNKFATVKFDSMSLKLPQKKKN
ncbi:MAG: serine/threonine-protein kinase [bacterium]